MPLAATCRDHDAGDDCRLDYGFDRLEWQVTHSASAPATTGASSNTEGHG